MTPEISHSNDPHSNAPAAVRSVVDVSILGRIGYDLYAEEHGIPLRDVRRFSRYVGGSSANMAVGLARLGLKVGIIGCVGDDPLSDYVLQYLRSEGVAVDRVQTSPGHLVSLCLTGICPPETFPQVFYRDRPADIRVRVGPEERELISGSRLFITNGTSLSASPSRESTFQALEWAHEAGLKVAFDVDYRAMSWKSSQEAGLYARLALPFVHVFIANPQEICLVAETERVDRAIEVIREKGVPLVAAKLGSDGVRISAPTESLFLRPYPIEVVSTIGAGDGFASGFLYGLFKSMPLSRALQFGNASAALVVNRLMCSEAMPRLEEVEELIGRHPEIQVTR